MKTTKEFGPNLRTAIHNKGYKTYKKAAEAFEISLSYLNQLMRNEREPSLELLQLMASELGVSSSLLLGESGEGPIKPIGKTVGEMTVDELRSALEKKSEPSTEELFMRELVRLLGAETLNKLLALARDDRDRDYVRHQIDDAYSLLGKSLSLDASPLELDVKSSSGLPRKNASNE